MEKRFIRLHAILTWLIIVVISLGSTVPGDVNFDGHVNVIDMTITSRIITGRYAATQYQKNIADMNRNGVVDLGDLELMKREVMR